MRFVCYISVVFKIIFQYFFNFLCISFFFFCRHFFSTLRKFSWLTSAGTLCYAIQLNRMFDGCAPELHTWPSFYSRQWSPKLHWCTEVHCTYPHISTFSRCFVFFSIKIQDFMIDKLQIKFEPSNTRVTFNTDKPTDTCSRVILWSFGAFAIFNNLVPRKWHVVARRAEIDCRG